VCSDISDVTQGRHHFGGSAALILVEKRLMFCNMHMRNIYKVNGKYETHIIIYNKNSGGFSGGMGGLVPGPGGPFAGRLAGKKFEAARAVPRLDSKLIKKLERGPVGPLMNNLF
jgi:hypothetical protein